MHDLIDDPAYATVKTQMIAQLKTLQGRWGDPLSLDHPPEVKPGDMY